MERRFGRFAVGVFTSALLAAFPTWASTLVRMDLPELTQRSEVIVRGKVLRTESRWSGDGMRILTDVEIEVAESLKGSVGKTVMVRQPGGAVGDIGQKVSGLASFEQGEEVVVFLSKKMGDQYRVSGAAQGKFKVERSSDGKAAFAIPDRVDEALVIDPLTRKPVAPRSEPVELNALRIRVRQLQQGKGK